MRRRGVRIDQDAAEHGPRSACIGKRDAALAEISAQLGTAVGMDEIKDANGRSRRSSNKASWFRTGPQKGEPSFANGGGKEGG